ncbi:TetR/AcrR family transcriptional regulator [Terribacillus sp. DMT04]|uniref:TetR/AcrR family transcriptional regulator n=1 Tax=Terribacillus sp. DMT04 TaxID=2850441 RepID=UPI001C2B946C|nr:TetR family transcriptional regulator C-terminal domain-containing protein [Terribacillus sp. DMT04]QXE02027.1 TetR family transcriptional regulator [Terribacillus sp. DMT04]
MPKKIDHEARKQDIAKATWQVILDGGIEAASVRNIAKSANLSLGALRHYFSTQEELLEYAMELVKSRCEARIIQVIQRNDPPKQLVTNVLLELLPINRESMAEMQVWFAFTLHLKYKQGDAFRQTDGIREAVQRALVFLSDSGELKERDLKKETEKLYALIDGLAIHRFLNPELFSGEYTTEILTEYMDDLCKK